MDTGGKEGMGGRMGLFLSLFVDNARCSERCMGYANRSCLLHGI